MRLLAHVCVRRSWILLPAALLITGSAVQDGRAAAQKGNKTEVVAQKNGVTCRTEHVAMRDGVLLATDVYLPPAPGRYPVIMQRTPYGLRLGHGCFDRLSGSMAFWAEHGYVGITQDSRGTYRSQGTFRPIVQEQADGYDENGPPLSSGRTARLEWQGRRTSVSHSGKRP